MIGLADGWLDASEAGTRNGAPPSDATLQRRARSIVFTTGGSTPGADTIAQCSVAGKGSTSSIVRRFSVSRWATLR
jgi:hypothetical protein